MIPSKKAELAKWIRTSIGEPVMETAELDSTQLEDRIDDAIDYYQLQGGETGNERQYLLINAGNPPISGVCSMSGGGPFSFCDPTTTAIIMPHRAEFQLPRNVIAVDHALESSTGGFGGLSWLTNAPGQDIIERGLNAAEQLSEAGWGFNAIGGPINTMTNSFGGLFFPGSFYSGGPYGSRGGVRAAGGGMDLITYELGMEYMEMLNQRYRVHVNLEFHPATRKVRIQPPPRQAGVYVIAVWSRVPPESLYDDYFIRQYALALTMMQIGRTMSKYKGAKFQGGVEYNADFFYSEGKESKEKLEQELLDNKWGFPPVAFRIG